MTIGEWLAAAGRELTAAGHDEHDGRRDLAVLARAALGWTPAQWLAALQDPAPDAFAAQMAPLVARRACGEPVAYLIGEREFYGRPFRVTRDVLIPRPETEGVVDAARRCLASVSADIPTVVDVGTGSGCLAITVALESPRARVVATDISAPALDVARENARRLGAADRITFLQGALVANVPGPIDLVVSNPPYVPSGDRAYLARDVADFEPATALFAGDDGLDVVRALVPAAAGILGADGHLVVEIGAGQAAAVRALIESAPGWQLVAIHPDLQQIPRVVVARRVAASL